MAKRRHSLFPDDGRDAAPAPPESRPDQQQRRIGRRRSAPKSAQTFSQPRTDSPHDANARVAKVVLPTPVDQEFDYLIPGPLVEHAVKGVRVKVPFGRQVLEGFVVDVVGSSPLGLDRLKDILEISGGGPLVNEEMLRLTRWMADYYACSWGEALEAVLPAVIRRNKALRTVGILRLAHDAAKTEEYVAALEAKGKKSERSPFRKQAKVLRTLLTFGDRNFRPAKLAEELGFTVAPIETMRRAGWVIIERVPVDDDMGVRDPAASSPPPTLTIEQEATLEKILPAIDHDEYRTFLLLGVTGSGKTEIYIRALEHALKAGKSGIVLVPEISLTPQTVRLLSARLEHLAGVAVLHSAMSDHDRRREWKRILSGEARLVIGPRSALFAPVKDLGVVVVDEEHETGYKQDSAPRYHARDVAVMRCFLQKAVCVLGSATPSIESMYNAGRGRYSLLELCKRVADRPMPPVTIVDMSDECRAQRRFAVFSRALLRCVEDAVKAGRQAILFLNRRGYNTFFQCETCRQIMLCPNCDVPMSLHAAYRRCICHYCHESTPVPKVCPSCKSGAMKALGIGTEFVEQEIRQRFSGFRVARMDSDSMKKREDYDNTLEQFRAGNIDVLVGTQMIAKGLDFPNVTVVGVIHADLNLYLADFRAQERTFQLITQVAGRAGRGDEAGMVLVQTFSPHHPCIETARAQNYHAFYEYELRQRKLADYPPFSRLVNVTVEARDKAKAGETAARIRGDLEDLKRTNAGRILDVLGPAPAPIPRVRGRHRMQLLTKVKDHEAMAIVSQRLHKHVKTTDSLRVIVDVDPYSLL